MQFLVTGGSGFLGINLIRDLLNRGHSVRSLDLVEFDYPDCADRVEAIRGDIRDESAVDESMKGIDVVVHAAAALPLYSAEDIRSTDIDGTRVLLGASLAAGVQRFVMISSTAVYGIPDHHPLLETDPLVGVGPYGKAKIAAEKVCEAFRDEGMCIPILRPKSFVGPERLGVFAMLYDWAHSGHGFPMIGNGSNRYQLLDVEDLVDAIYLCSTLDCGLVNDTFNLGAEEFGTMREDYQAVLDTAGFGRHVMGLPARPVIWALRILESLGLSPLYKWVYETASKDSFVSTEKARTILGWRPKYSNEDALVRNYEWYVEHLNEFAEESGVSHRVPWKQGILSFAKRFF